MTELHTNHTEQLTSSELSGLWATYLSDSLLECVYTYFISSSEDADIKTILLRTLDIARKHKTEKTVIFQKEGHVIPLGFTNSDIHVNAPKLFTDEYLLSYTKQALQGALGAYSSIIPHTFRKDIREHFLSANTDALELYDELTDLMQSKGLSITSPIIPYLKEIDMVEKKKFFNGWFGKERPLTSIEITQLYSNTLSNDLGVLLMKGFSQCAKKEELRNLFTEGKELGKKHVNRFSKYLQNADLPVPTTNETSVLNVTDSPFSDKLMLTHTTAIITNSIGYYGIAISQCSRTDLIKDFSESLIEAGTFAAKAGALLVENGWLESPPHAEDSR